MLHHSLLNNAEPNGIWLAMYLNQQNENHFCGQLRNEKLSALNKDFSSKKQIPFLKENIFWELKLLVDVKNPPVKM